jgi:hypothetical protein
MPAAPAPLHISFFFHANLQYAEFPADAARALVESYRPVRAISRSAVG